jgi:sucrose-6-phosphate hydrolase SacC (GH32 family)
MSWGHATSTDLVHWKHQPVALLASGYSDSITEMFFSGTAVAVTQNSSGFGINGTTPLAAIYTSMVGRYLARRRREESADPFWLVPPGADLTEWQVRGSQPAGTVHFLQS